MNDLGAVLDRIREGRRFLVIGHIKPDGDDVSSVASLVSILRKAGKEAEGCIADGIPWFFQRIAGVGLIKGVGELRGYGFDTSITVDASDLSRIGRAIELLDGGIPDITLDHHKTNRGFGKIDFCDPSYAAAALIVYEIGKALIDYDQELAETTLLGIATDTGFFKYANTDERVFSSAAELVRAGASVQRIASAVLEHRTVNEINLLVDMFETLEISAGGRLATAYISAEMLERNGCTEDDTSGMVGEIRAIDGVEVAILFVECPKRNVHVSLRSKERVDVSEIAIDFGGGGHARAAGCGFTGSDLGSVRKKVIAAAERAIESAFPG